MTRIQVDVHLEVIWTGVPGECMCVPDAQEPILEAAPPGRTEIPPRSPTPGGSPTLGLRRQPHHGNRVTSASPAGRDTIWKAEMRDEVSRTHLEGLPLLTCCSHAGETGTQGMVVTCHCLQAKRLREELPCAMQRSCWPSLAASPHLSWAPGPGQQLASPSPPGLAQGQGKDLSLLKNYKG